MKKTLRTIALTLSVIVILRALKKSILSSLATEDGVRVQLEVVWVGDVAHSLNGVTHYAVLFAGILGGQYTYLLPRDQAQRCGKVIGSRVQIFVTDQQYMGGMYMARLGRV